MAKFSGSVKSTFNFDAEKVRNKIAGRLYRFGERVMGVSKDRVPVDTGNLMSTGRVELPVDDGKRISVVLGYGSTAVDYALKVHEEMSPHVHWKRPGSGPKYLENPLKELQNELPGEIAAGFEEGLK